MTNEEEKRDIASLLALRELLEVQIARSDRHIVAIQEEDLPLKVAVLTAAVADIRHQIDTRLSSTRDSLQLALTAAEKTIGIAQMTADRAEAKAEAAAGREYLESQINGLRTSLYDQIMASKESLTAALEASQRAVAKAEQANEKRFESVNEFRAALNDAANRLLPRSEAEARFSAISETLARLERFQNTTQGAQSGIEGSTKMNLAIAGLVLTAMIAAISLVFNLVKWIAP